jgi:calcium/calmodulin-dependent protein kinase I
MEPFDFSAAIGPFRKVRPLALQKHSQLFIVTDSRAPATKRIMKVVAGGDPAGSGEPLICPLLHHPSVLPLVDAFPWGAHQILVFPLITGGTLAQAVASAKYARPEHAARVMRRLLSAVAYLHSINVLHGDISPNNIMFESDRPILIDFGTAEMLCDDQVSECAIGTLPYVAPERKKMQSTLASDVYSLGMTFAYLTGHTVWAVAANRYASFEIFKGHPCEPLLSDLLYGMTRVLARARYSIDACLRHAFWVVLERGADGDLPAHGHSIFGAKN